MSKKKFNAYSYQNQCLVLSIVVARNGTECLLHLTLSFFSAALLAKIVATRRSVEIAHAILLLLAGCISVQYTEHNELCLPAVNAKNSCPVSLYK